LTHFKYLKILKISQEALLGREPNQISRTLLHHILLSSLEVLEIFWSYISILEWLQDVVSYKKCFPKLYEIGLFLRNHHGDGYELFVYKDYPLWQELRSSNISIDIWWYPEDYHPEWVDKYYDPFICDILALLNSLRPDAKRVADDPEDLSEADLDI
jgi:hypothetical protein